MTEQQQARPGQEDAARRSRTAAPRRGSDTSDKQIAQAAMRGRQVIFRWLNTQPQHEVRGYVVGMDDYHWLVASPVPETDREPGADPTTLHLVHRSASLIVLPPDETLSEETPQVQEAVRRVGHAFWRYCETRYSGRTSSGTTQEN